MITRKQKDFNMEMGSYLDNRTGDGSDSSNSFFKKVDALIPRFKRDVDSSVPEDVDVTESTVYERKRTRSFFSILFGSSNKSYSEDNIDEDEILEEIKEEIDQTEHQLEDMEEEVEEIEDRQEGIIRRFFALLRFNRYRQKEDDYGEEVPQDMVDKAMGKDREREELEAETRAVLKLTHTWISKLSPEQIDSFKRSSDFARYKELLKVYGLIK